jgi:hypothetical protein
MGPPESAEGTHCDFPTLIAQSYGSGKAAMPPPTIAAFILLLSLSRQTHVYLSNLDRL